MRPSHHVSVAALAAFIELRVAPPRVGSPRVGSPRVGSPRVGSPRVGSPRVAPPPSAGIDVMSFNLSHGRRDDGAHDGVLVTGPFNGFRGHAIGGAIDAVLLSSDWLVDSARMDRRWVQPRWPSHHVPVTARVRQSRQAP